MRGVFVTGTDTSVGKTVVTCALTAAFRARGRRVGVHKPIETGCSIKHGRLAGEDGERLRAAGGGKQAFESVTSHLFELAAAPLAAARAAGAEIETPALVAGANSVVAANDITFIEGAGGLLVPIADRYTFLDFARDLGLPALVVVGSKLGCINHALLTLDALEASGIPCAGFIMNCIDRNAEPGPESNLEMIREFTNAHCLGIFPSVPTAACDDYRRLGELAAEHLDLEILAS